MWNVWCAFTDGEISCQTIPDSWHLAMEQIQFQSESHDEARLGLSPPIV
jgi:hypothetical protein